MKGIVQVHSLCVLLLDTVIFLLKEQNNIS